MIILLHDHLAYYSTLSALGVDVQHVVLVQDGWRYRFKSCGASTQNGGVRRKKTASMIQYSTILRMTATDKFRMLSWYGVVQAEKTD